MICDRQKRSLVPKKWRHDDPSSFVLSETEVSDFSGVDSDIYHSTATLKKHSRHSFLLKKRRSKVTSAISSSSSHFRQNTAEHSSKKSHLFGAEGEQSTPNAFAPELKSNGTLASLPFLSPVARKSSRDATNKTRIVKRSSHESNLDKHHKRKKSPSNGFNRNEVLKRDQSIQISTVEIETIEDRKSNLIPEEKGMVSGMQKRNKKQKQKM